MTTPTNDLIFVNSPARVGWKTMKKTIFLLGIQFVIITSSSAATEPTSTSPQNVPKPELQITIDSLSKPNTFLLWALNRGKSNLLIIRPRSGMLDRFENWGGWSVRVQGPAGPFTPFPFPSGVPQFTSLDLMELRPDESIGVVLNLDIYIPGNCSFPCKDRLANTPGKYTIVASYYLDQDKVIGETSETVIAVPRLQPVESRALQFVVQEDQNQSAIQNGGQPSPQKLKPQAEEPQQAVKTQDCSLPLPSMVHFSDSFDWNNCTPKDFLAFLHNYDKTSYIVFENHRGWVKERDLPGLFALLDSTERCANVASVVSSFIDQNRSTLGNEAAWLISSFRASQYPPSLNSTRPKPDKEALRSWWRKRLQDTGER